MRRASSNTVAFLVCVSALALNGCGQQASAPAPSGTPIGAAAVDADAQAAAEAKAAELAAREQELAEREAALRQQEQDAEAERARKEAEAVAAAEKAAAAQKAAAAKKAAAAPVARPVSTAPVPRPAPVAAPIFVPPGTPLEVALASNLTTRSLAVGTPVSATLASDLVVDGRRAARAGAPVQGTVTEVVSGSNKIGGIPKIALRFDTLVAADGSTRTINADWLEQGKSETARDTAKIVGGAAAGAVIGHQVDDDKGRVIGGLLGAGAGAIAAKKTGGEINPAAGQVLTVATSTGFEVRP